MRFKAAALQMCSGLIPAQNVATVAAAAKQAKAAGADYLQTPEMTTLVNRDRAAMMAAIGDDKVNPELDALRTIAPNSLNTPMRSSDEPNTDANG